MRLREPLEESRRRAGKSVDRARSPQPTAAAAARPFTIVAPATPPVSGGVGILRLSGPHALSLVAPLTPRVPANPVSRHVYFTDFTDAVGAILDQGLFIYFRAPNSYTGEDVVELHVHGSPRLLQLLQAQLLRDHRVRLAEPGEFTRRAFLNGRIDLARAEAIADLISADSEAAVRAAARQVQGLLSARVRALRDPLRELHSELEGILNFPVEAEGVDLDLPARLAAIRHQARDLLGQAERGRLVRRGARVVLFGPVNAGKSTLFNQILREPRALVDEEPGTTRDLLEAKVEIGGLGITLVDTAGLRKHPGRLEALGMGRALEAVQTADLAVLVMPPAASAREIHDWTQETSNAPVLRVRSKSDIALCESCGDLHVSGLTRHGVDLLEQEIVARLWGGGVPQASELTSERHGEALRRAMASVDRALEAVSVSTLEVVSGEIGLAVEALGEITGENAPEELLNAIFQRFCIGK